MARSPAKAPKPAPRFKVSGAIGALGSVLLHAGAFVWMTTYGAAPDVGLELSFPSEVEFGLTEQVDMGAPAQPPSQAPAAESGDDDERGDDEGLGLDGGTPEPDGGPEEPDAGKAVAQADAGVADGGEAVAAAKVDAGGVAGEGEGTLPAGAQIALRLDMRKVRDSSLAPKVRAVLEVMPDWQRLLAGSGIDPLEDLDRVLIAHPGKVKPSGWLDPSATLIAGEHAHDQAFVRKAVDAMASARGQSASWSPQLGVPTAPWHDRSDTPRIVALIGPRQFSVTRPEDLAPLLAVAKARAEGGDEDGGSAGPDAQQWADALLSMDEDVALSLEVEGGRRFVRGIAERAPTSLALSVRETDSGHIGLDGEGTFDTPEQAERARDFWNRQREHYAGNPWVALVNMDDPLREAELEADEERVTFGTSLTPAQIRLALGFVEDFFRKHGRPPVPPP